MNPKTLSAWLAAAWLSACAGPVVADKDDTGSDDTDVDSDDTDIATDDTDPPTDDTDPPTDDTDATDETDATDDTDIVGSTDDTDPPTDDTDVATTDDTDLPPTLLCAAPPPAAVAPTVLWSGSLFTDFDEGALSGTFGPSGVRVFADQTALSAFLTTISGPAVTADFEQVDVMAAWFYVSSTCGADLDLLAWHDDAGVTQMVAEYENSSRFCCIVCDMLAGQVEVVSFPKGTPTAQACLEPTGGCTIGDTGTCGP